MKKSSGAGRKTDGNITVDLGEKLDRVIRTASMAGKGAQIGSRGKPGYRPAGSYRPGMWGMGAYRPWYSQKSGFNLGKILDYPQSLSTNDALTGALLGTAGNRLVARFVPDIIPTNSRLAVDAIAFGVGLIPLLAKPNAMTVGVALPGLVFLAGSLSDMLLDMVGMARPALSGGHGGSPAHLQAQAARQRLAEVQARINRQAVPAGVPRVVAQPAYVR